ncbi:hypothetical protein M427DRAFT_352541 [Gonapodya prolifera JEL478]|uniref:Uncharacterized protein n=1 Tax=Gonapodya prolifera (strain JEL478) TaxID=1344416 RepID=A0A139ABW8_GONPJ|nr:hypothetical protein M427DRAFT_352541 [Gonapodya prolifera JEL478]|eukprot:KXS14260.1 hypothetical protein M427DRAFT_352541 [Gonapodya prolifera JEL478]
MTSEKSMSLLLVTNSCSSMPITTPRFTHIITHSLHKSCTVFREESTDAFLWISDDVTSDAEPRTVDDGSWLRTTHQLSERSSRVSLFNFHTLVQQIDEYVCVLRGTGRLVTNWRQRASVPLSVRTRFW